MIPVTKPFLPPIEEYQTYVEQIWSRNWLTNDGPLVNELELRLKSFLGVKFLHYVSNGTLALQLAIKALELKGEIITTPFSFVATTSSIVWEGCKPVFVDIDPDTFNIDPNKIEAAITKNTSAIVATHVFGNPCDIDAIEFIARKHGLKVIYDAAHCFGTKYKGRSVLNYGDVSCISFHATKVFHTTEGGAVVTRDPKLSEKLLRMRNFGYGGKNPLSIVGINAKNSEFHAAMGLCNLNYINSILDKRKEQYGFYRKVFSYENVKLQNILSPKEYNHAYFPIVFTPEINTIQVLDLLESKNIYARRYFHPTLANLDYLNNKTKANISRNIANQVLCLPLYHMLSPENLDMIAREIRTMIYSHEHKHRILLHKNNNIFNTPLQIHYL